MQDFKELQIWQKAHSLVLQIYRVSKDLPPSESFGLILHLRRSAFGIAKDIAQGAGRGTDAEFAVDLKRARASGHELEYLLILSRDLGFLEEPVHDRLAGEVVDIRKMISGLLRRFKVDP